jgi:divalent metal cation (Fe/Co/Zn/Cd) transporter
MQSSDQARQRLKRGIRATVQTVLVSTLLGLVDIHVQVDGRLTVVEGHAIGHEVKRTLFASDLRIVDVLVHLEPDQDPAAG